MNKTVWNFSHLNIKSSRKEAVTHIIILVKVKVLKNADKSRN